MGLFSRNKHQDAIDEMEKDLIETEEAAEFRIETPVANFEEEVAIQEEAPVQKHEAPVREEAKKESQDWLTDYEGTGQLTIDVYQTDDNIVIKSTIAGVTAQDLDVSINGDMLSIHGTRKKGEVIPDEDYFYAECYWGPFSRSVILPTEVRAEKIDAQLTDGILTITLPKAQKDKTRKIVVKTAK